MTLASGEGRISPIFQRFIRIPVGSKPCDRRRGALGRGDKNADGRRWGRRCGAWGASGTPMRWRALGRCKLRWMGRKGGRRRAASRLPGLPELPLSSGADKGAAIAAIDVRSRTAIAFIPSEPVVPRSLGCTSKIAPPRRSHLRQSAFLSDSDRADLPKPPLPGNLRLRTTSSEQSTGLRMNGQWGTRVPSSPPVKPGKFTGLTRSCSRSASRGSWALRIPSST